MNDLGLAILSLLFLVASLGLISGFERLKGGETR